MEVKMNEADTINTCKVCGRKFFAPGEMQDPLCMICEKARQNTKTSTKEEAPMSKSQEKISEVMDSMKDLLLYKNQMYGDAALNPIGIFTKHLKTAPVNAASTLVNLDNKLGRVKNAPELRINDISDIIGYCTLLLVSMGATKEDIEKFKD